LIYSSFQRAEFITAIHLKEGRGFTEPAATRQALADMEKGIRSGLLRWYEPDWNRIFSLTSQLSTTHGASSLCRTLDAIHVSLALSLKISEFVTLDKRQAILAKAAGLKCGDSVKARNKTTPSAIISPCSPHITARFRSCFARGLSCIQSFIIGLSP
jgi:predicted nucleic acid-binding protein